MIWHAPSSSYKSPADALKHRSEEQLLPSNYKTGSIDSFEERKLRIFGHLNRIQLLSGLILFYVGLVRHPDYGVATWMIIMLPVVLNGIILLLSLKKMYRLSIGLYFGLYPFLTCVVYLNRLATGQELSLILCAILSVFFLEELGYRIFSVLFSIVSYFALFIVRDHIPFPPTPIDEWVYFVNEGTIFIYIFYSLFLLKNQRQEYQHLLAASNAELMTKGIESMQHDRIIHRKTVQLNRQATLLRKSNLLKTQLFSLVSHDLKDPMFALRNYFQLVSRNKLSPADFENMIPEVMKELNHSIGLVENLLEWAKCQMRSCEVNVEKINVGELLNEMVLSFELPAKIKGIRLACIKNEECYVTGDLHMIRLIIRNLLSNAIKFTAPGGQVTFGAEKNSRGAKIFIRDSGIGIDRSRLRQINSKSFFTSPGTNKESGTGLGLMLCREFLSRNRSRLTINSEPGKGTECSFILLRYKEKPEHKTRPYPVTSGALAIKDESPGYSVASRSETEASN